MGTQNERENRSRRLLRQAMRLAGILIAALLLFGCSADREHSVSGNVATPPARTATKLPSAAPTGEIPPATSAPSPTPAEPAPWAFPMAARRLFSPGAVPEGIYFPFGIIEGKQTFLYATKDNKVFSAQWKGAGYVSTPLAENVAAGCGYVDRAGQRLFGQGSRYISADRSDPVIVMVDMATSKRCNIDELVGWKEEGLLLSTDYQYYNGMVLSRLQQYSEGKYAALNQWALVDVASKKYSILDLTGFREKNLQQWQQMKELRLALVGGNRLLAVCTLLGTVGTQAMAGDPDAEGCVALMLDMNGNAVQSPAIVSGALGQGSSAIAHGKAFDTSPDGKYLLYSDNSSTGIFLYDVAKNMEHVILKSGSPSRVFAQWGEGGSIYYGTEPRQGQGDVTVVKTTIAEVLSKS